MTDRGDEWIRSRWRVSSSLVKRRPRQPGLKPERLEARRVLAGTLVSHWLADDLSSTLADDAEVSSWNDAIRQAAAVTVVGTPRLVHDSVGGRAGVRFDAADGGDLLQVAWQNNPMSRAADFSVTVAFVTSAALKGTDQAWFDNTGLVDGSNLGITQDWGISLNALGQPSVGLGGGLIVPSDTLYSSAIGLNDGQLHVISFTRREGSIALHVDELAPDRFADADAGARARNEMVFGGLLTRANYYSGDITEVRVFDGQLTDQEVASVHQEILNYYNNQPPSTNDDTYAVDEDQTLIVDASAGLLANDSDADGDVMSAVLISPPRHGQLSVRPDGSLTYQPEADFFGDDSFTYVAQDFRPSDSPATVSIRVRPVHDPAVPVADQYKTDPATPLDVPAVNGVLHNDGNTDNANLTAVLVTDVEQGSLVINADGSFQYDSQGFSGQVTFEYQIDDGFVISAPQTVTIVVNTRPQATPDSYETLEDQALEIDAVMGLLANDHDDDGQMLSAVVDTPSRGDLTLREDGSFTYIPPPDFAGNDFFTYRVTDGIDLSIDKLVHLRIRPVNDAPAALSDSYFALLDQTLQVQAHRGVLANDSDSDSAKFDAALVRRPENGTITLNPDGSFVYSPNAGFEGADTFAYRADDSIAQSEETVVTIRVTSRPIIISEFMASNGSALGTRLRASSGDRFRGESFSPDWIELRNLLDQPIDLGGMHLTDDVLDPGHWQFPPNTLIPARGYLVVFASGENITDSSLDENGYLHTNFQLAAGGDYLALTGPGESRIHEYAPEYPPQQTDISYGIAADDSSVVGYFLQSTPGSENRDPRRGSVAAVQFSVHRGFFEDPFELEITTATPDAIIRYTTDGAAPTDTHGEVYRGGITVDRTTAIRAAAFQTEMLPTDIVTQTYFFLEDVLDQSSTPPEGFPQTWGGTLTDWGMDQDASDLAAIAGDENLTLGQAREVIKKSLLSLPTMSIVTTVDGMFGSRNGIYANTQGRGMPWERPTSVEYIDPSGAEPGFQVDAGIRIQGFTSRDPNRNPKHSFRLVMRPEYGAPQLQYPLFGFDAATAFDTIVLRSNSQDAWVYDSGDNRQGQFVRDQWARETQLAMGQPAAHGTWVHLYVNGLYWGVYNPTERPDASFSASYLGGNPEDYDAVKNHEEVINGNSDAYVELLTQIQRNPRNFGSGYLDLSNAADYQRLQGNNPDGRRNPQLPVLIDVPNLIDYIIHGAYAAANDWPGNYYMGRDRTENSTGFKFFMWDNEHGMKPSVNVNRTLPHSRDNDSPTKFYHALRSNEDFRLLFADHLHRAFFNGGPLYVDPQHQAWDREQPQRNVPAARWMEITGQIEEALIAEAARWGDVRRIQYTPHNQFQSLRDRLLRTWFPRRSEIVFEQFKSLGLYPDHAAPVFSQHGGSIQTGFLLEMTNPGQGGQIFYTLDGSDPRDAQTIYSAPVRLSGELTVKSRVLYEGEWSALNEASFSDAIPADTASLRVSEINYNPAVPTADESAAGFSDNEDFEFIELVNVAAHSIDLSTTRLIQVDVDGNQEGVYFDFADGDLTHLEPNETILVVEDLDAFAYRYGNDRPVAGQWQGKLGNGGEMITVQAGEQIVQQFAYSDLWHPSTDGGGRTLEAVNPSADDLAAWGQSAGWRPSATVNGSPGIVHLGLLPGDSNRDGVFDSSDVVLVFRAGEYEDAFAGNSTYEEGDWNQDGDFTSSDLVFAFQAGHYVAAALPGELGDGDETLRVP